MPLENNVVAYAVYGAAVTMATVLVLTWKKYYWRVIGMFLAGGGLWLIWDELNEGPFNLLEVGHELYGVILFIVGLVCISLKPKGKDTENEA